MKPEKSKRTKRTVFIIGGILCSLPIIYIIILAISWTHSDNLNVQRLKVLQADGVLSCNIGQITASHTEDVNARGTTHGIGFGGTSPTVVSRDYYLNNADSKTVLDAFNACAQANGWKTSPTPGEPGVQGEKTFSGGWQASLLITIDRLAPHDKQPVVNIYIDTDGI